ncbi:hypothetical protein ACVWW6_001331 [Bradyrhizobium sp. USDA 3311]
MPIMAAYDENDARGPARVLANTVRRCMEEGKEPPKYVSAFDNFYSMIEDYKSHGFEGFDYVASGARGPEALNLLPSPERHVDDLRVAFDRALQAVYSDVERDVALGRVENVLRAVAYPKTASASGDERLAVRNFLAVFINNLYSTP